MKKISECLKKHHYDSSVFSECPMCSNGIASLPAPLQEVTFLSEIGHGTFGKVYRVMHKGECKALKIAVHDNGSIDKEYAEKEIQMLNEVKASEFITTMEDYWVIESNDKVCFYMLFPVYESLIDVLVNEEIDSVIKCLNVCYDVALAAAELNRKGICHLDIKPMNIYRNASGHFILGDLGSAQYMADIHSIQSSNIRLGTKWYWAPEVFYENKYSVSSDIYSLGILLYCLLNGMKFPFAEKLSIDDAFDKRMRTEKLPSLDHGSYAVQSIVERMCAYDTHERYADFNDIVISINEVIKSGDPSLHSSLSQSVNDNDAIDVPTGKLHYHAMATSVALPSHQLTGVEWHSAATTSRPKPQSALVTPRKVGKVDFSVVSSETVKPGSYSLIDVFMYTKGQRYIVDKAIKYAKEKSVEAARSNVPMQIKQGETVTLLLSSSDVEIESAAQSLAWDGDVLDYQFKYRVPDAYRKKEIDFCCVVLREHIPVMRLFFSVKVNSAKTVPLKYVRKHIKKAFVSYSSKDREKVIAHLIPIQQASPRAKFWMDYQSLASGDAWRPAIARAIESSDVFLLFWSNNSRNSEEVRKELSYALEIEKRKFTSRRKYRSRFITPVPLESPANCPPPEELSMLHFNDPSLEIQVEGIRFERSKTKNIKRIKR